MAQAEGAVRRRRVSSARSEAESREAGELRARITDRNNLVFIVVWYYCILT
ncbi:MAG TPA: hypothetical protein P5257_10535 [Bacteroidales bacterium]|nr:hypothetical protein [Bacteroidales bacterium]